MPHEYCYRIGNTTVFAATQDEIVAKAKDELIRSRTSDSQLPRIEIWRSIGTVETSPDIVVTLFD